MIAEKEKKGAGLQKKPVKCPRKTGINMNQQESRTAQARTLTVGVVLIALLAGLTAKVGVIDQFRRLSEAQNDYEQVHRQLQACQTALEDYGRVLTEYRTYSMDWMTGSDQEGSPYVTVRRQDVLDLVERRMMPRGTVSAIVIQDDLATVSMSGMSLAQISEMFDEMEREPIVAGVELDAAETDKNQQASSILDFSVRIRLQAEVAE